MPSPVGHSLAGYLISDVAGVRLSRRKWVSLGSYVLIANAPDIDYLPGFLSGKPNAFHHYATHSVTAALLFGIAVAIILGSRDGGFVRIFLATSAAYASHLLLDFFTLDTSKPYGMQLLWPLSDRFYVSPWALFMDVAKGNLNEGFMRSLLVWHNLVGMLWEAAVFVPLIFGLHVMKRRAGLNPS